MEFWIGLSETSVPNVCELGHATVHEHKLYIAHMFLRIHGLVDFNFNQVFELRIRTDVTKQEDRTDGIRKL